MMSLGPQSIAPRVLLKVSKISDNMDGGNDAKWRMIGHERSFIKKSVGNVRSRRRA